MNELKQYLAFYAKNSESFLSKWIVSKEREAGRIDPILKNVVETFYDYSKGGKKIRGALTVLGYQMAGGKDLKRILPVSCGVEFLHNFFLVHDDIIDNDKLRRGKPTIHESLGIPKAIIIGDTGAFLGYELVLGSGSNEAASVLNSLLLKTAYGELLDIYFDDKRVITWDDIMKVRTYKTAYYTFVMPITVGAILGKADKAQLKAIKNFGLNLGVAFQLADDILGIYGDIKKTGKSNDSDIIEGKKTLLYSKALFLAGKKDRDFLLKNYGKKGIGKLATGEIRRIIAGSGALAFSEKTALEFAEKAKQYIAPMTSDAEFRKILFQLAEFVVSRDR